jgi:rhamnosyltransferase
MTTVRKIAAIIVAYYPDNNKLAELANALHFQSCDKVVIFKNSNLDDSLVSQLDFCDFIGTGNNDGLGKAINLSFLYLKEVFGADFSAFTFDQDTELTDGFVENMNQLHMNLKSSGSVVSAIVPRIFDKRSPEYEYKLPRRESYDGFHSLRVALQSGMFIDVGTWENDKFNEELFIEFVDTEWCYRLAGKGKHIYLSQDAVIYHEVSDELPRPFLGMKLLKYSPLRRYYFYRNSFFMFRSKNIPSYDKFLILRAFVNRFVSIFIFDEPKYQSIKLSGLGVFDGIRSKFGKRNG